MQDLFYLYIDEMQLYMRGYHEGFLATQANICPFQTFERVQRFSVVCEFISSMYTEFL